MGLPAKEDRKWEEIEEIVRQSQAQAVAAQFAAAVMHEINSPLEAAFNLNYLIQQNAEDAEAVREFALEMEDQFSILARLSRQTLRYFRSSDTTERIAVATLAEAALRVHRQKIVAKKIRLQKNFPADILVEVQGGDLLQVISNLISNAIEALPENGSLRLRASHSRQEAHLTVADNGSGIPAEISSRIFDPFFTTKRDRGTGLGLALSKSIVERHRGRIRAHSSIRSGRSGTAFRISLPLAPMIAGTHA